MIDQIVGIFRSYPEIAIFLALAIGYLIGKIKYRGFGLGSTTGVLIAALVIGQMDVKIPSLVSAIALALFMFCMGYQVGPQVVNALKREGLRDMALALIVALVGLVTAIGLGKLLAFDKGTTAGLLGGAMTQSSLIGTAQGAIKHLDVSAATQTTLENNIAIAYAITYVFGVAGPLLMFMIVPRLLRIDFKQEARKLEEEMHGGSDDLDRRPELFSWHKQLDLRAYRVTKENVVGKTVHELEALLPGNVAVERMKRGDQLIDPEPDTVVQSGDLVAIVGEHAEFIQAEDIIGPEVDEPSMTDLIGEILDICVLSSEAVGKTLGEISAEHGHGIFLKRITRQGYDLPLTRKTVLNKCDVVQVAGAEKDVERLVEYLGYPERPTEVTDLIMIGVGCVLGTLVGLLSVKIAGIPITLGVGGGVLVSGLVFGWLRAVHPTFGQIPSGAQWLFTNLGLNLFIACVGLNAGPSAVEGLQTAGLRLLLAGVVVTLVPLIVGLLFGQFVLKMNPVLLFGALAGADTATPTLNQVKEEADSSMPVLGFTVPYAVGNVILTIWGTIVVALM